VTTGASIDHEKVPHYWLTISACQHAAAAAADDDGDVCPNANITMTLSIIVLDVNDNAPKFDRASYSVTLHGDELPGTHIIQVQAVDNDSTSTNSLITYRLDSASDHLFTVDCQSGWVSVTDRLNDVHGPHTLTVVAEDHGTPVMSTSTNVHISVLSRRPRITSPPHQATVFINQVCLVVLLEQT